MVCLSEEMSQSMSFCHVSLHTSFARLDYSTKTVSCLLSFSFSAFSCNPSSRYLTRDLTPQTICPPTCGRNTAWTEHPFVRLTHSNSHANVWFTWAACFWTLEGNLSTQINTYTNMMTATYRWLRLQPRTFSPMRYTHAHQNKYFVQSFV